MNARNAIVLGVGLTFLNSGFAILADTIRSVDCVCPLCKTKFTAVLTMSGTMFNRRLDLRPVGAIRSPWPVPVCTKCGFAMFRQLNEKYTDDELDKLRKFVASEAYRKLPTTAGTHERLAKIFEFLGRAPEEMAHVYLQASWQAEDKKDVERNRALLEKSREWLEKYLASSPEKDEKWRTLEYLRGELLRRVGKFDEAKKHFDRLIKIPAFQEGPMPQLISQQMSLIKNRNASPKEMVRSQGGNAAGASPAKAA